MALRPKVLPLDEPLSAQDLKHRQVMSIEPKQIQNETTVNSLFVSHVQDEAPSMPDEIAVLSAGGNRQLGITRFGHRTRALNPTGMPGCCDNLGDVTTNSP